MKGPTAGRGERSINHARSINRPLGVGFWGIGEGVTGGGANSGGRGPTGGRGDRSVIEQTEAVVGSYVDHV